MKTQEMQDIEDAAYFMTIILSTVHPGLNKDETMELMVEMFCNGLDEESAKAYGEAIRNTALPVNKTQH